MASSTSIKKVKVTDLIPYANNSRLHSDEQVLQIASSIKEFGFLNPIIVDGDNGIIAGHGRVMAAKKLGIEELPCIDASHLTPAQKKAYVIADNKIALNSEWDNEILRIELNILDELDFDLELTGFSTDELDALSFDDDSGADFGESQDGKASRQLDDEKYTTKIETPIYEMKGKKPDISEIYNTTKTSELYSKIKKANLPDDVSGFLMAAASRHTVFNYELIAEFYAHQDKDVQELMEDSALVIIDYNKAIESGYVKLTKALMQLSGESDNVAE